MAIPIISGNQSVLAYGLGQDFVFQLTASESPTQWEIAATDTLPAGVLFDTLRGTFAGAGYTVGVWNLTVRAKNSDGWSLPVMVTLGIFDVAAKEVYRDVKILLDSFEVVPNPFDAEEAAEDENEDDGIDVSMPPAMATARIGDDLVWKISFAKPAVIKTTTPAKTTVGPDGGTVPASSSEVAVTQANNLFTAKSGGKETTFEIVNAPLVMARFAMRGGVSDPPFLQTDKLAFKKTTEIVGADFVTSYFIYASLADNPALEAWLSEKETDLEMANSVTCEFELEFTTPSRAPGPNTQIVTTKPFQMRIRSDIAR
jgi:hypothetical protein